MARIDRRAFLSAAGVATVSAAVPRAMLRAADPDGEDFSFLLLGDTHFDREEHHDFDWMKEHYEKDISQVRGYVRKTRQTLPLVFQAAKERLAGATPPARMVVHAGDAVEGICGRPDLALRQCREFFEFYDRERLSLPLFATKGNHDITGPGAAEAYREVFLGRIGEQLGRKTESACYTVERGKALLAFFDAYDPGALEWLEGRLGERTAEHLLVVLHPPVVPYNARSNWCVFSHPNQAERRKRLLELLGRHQAVVLTGHLHKYSVVVRRTGGGRFVQLGLSSVVDRADQPVRDAIQGVERYGGHLTDLEPGFQPDSAEARKALLEAERPLVEHFDYADTAGFALIKVQRGGITADIHVGASPQPWKSIDLSGLVREATKRHSRMDSSRRSDSAVSPAANPSRA